MREQVRLQEEWLIFVNLELLSMDFLEGYMSHLHGVRNSWDSGTKLILTKKERVAYFEMGR
jgi:hypothetical protein